MVDIEEILKKSRRVFIKNATDIDISYIPKNDKWITTISSPFSKKSITLDSIKADIELEGSWEVRKLLSPIIKIGQSNVCKINETQGCVVEKNERFLDFFNLKCGCFPEDIKKKVDEVVEL